MIDQQHPDLDWARARFGRKDPTTEELSTLQWDCIMGCYLMRWRGMTLGLEKDGHIHS